MRLSSLSCIVCSALVGQTRWTSSPRGFETMPGNAGLSMPVRWTVGLMQVLVEQSVLPATLASAPLVRIRLRRAAFASDPPDPARTLDCELRLGNSGLLARHLTPDMVANRPGSLTVVAARRSYNVPATPALGPGDAVAADFVDLPLDAPFSFAGPNLFLEWQNWAPSQDVSPGHWVDAVHFPGGVDLGLVVQAGAHGCGSRGGAAMVLEAGSSSPPAAGATFPVLLRRAAPTSACVLLTFFDPMLRSPLGLRFGQALGAAGMPGCYLWAGPDLQVGFTSDASGDGRAGVGLPNSSLLRGRTVSMQAVTLDRTANAPGVATSSGLLLRPDFVGVYDRAVTVLEYRSGSTSSPWLPFLGLMPVLLLGS